MSLPHLRAGIVTPPIATGGLCVHCSRPLAGAERCRCGFGHDPRRTSPDLAEVVLRPMHFRAAT